MSDPKVRCWRCFGPATLSAERCPLCGAPNPGGPHGPAKMDKDVTMNENNDAPIPFTPVKTYRALDAQEIDMMNEVKTLEATVAKVHSIVRQFANGKANPTGEVLPVGPQRDAVNEVNRQLSLARTAFEQAFMHLSRAIARPDSPWLQNHLDSGARRES